jgi:hypothetical protein
VLLPGVEGGVTPARRADRTLDTAVGIADVDEGEPLHLPRRRTHGHD